MKVILVSGKAQHGKDTIANIIKQQLLKDNHRVLIAHYGDLVKYICTTYFGWDGNKDEFGRGLLQYVGTDVIRAQCPTFWVDFVSSMLKFFYENWDYVIIPDCRFPNEINIIAEKFDALHVRVVRENFISPLTDEQKKHPSETSLDNTVPDFFFLNNKTIQELQDTVIKWVKEKLYG